MSSMFGVRRRARARHGSTRLRTGTMANDDDGSGARLNVAPAQPQNDIDAQQAPASVTLRQALPFWLKLGFISFGGPAGQIAIMHTELVERRRWISEKRFLHALNYCMLLPGPGGAATRDLHRLADAPHLGRHRRRRAVRAAVAVHPDRAVVDLRALRRRAGRRRHLLRHQAGGHGAGAARGASHRVARAEERVDVGDRRGGVRGDLRAATCRSRPSSLAAGADRALRRARAPDVFALGGGHARGRQALRARAHRRRHADARACALLARAGWRKCSPPASRCGSLPMAALVGVAGLRRARWRRWAGSSPRPRC